MTDPIPNWPKETRILVILAHPDDPEFFLGGTIAMWTSLGYQVQYCLLTAGEKGVSPEFPDCEPLARIRHMEQKKAASILGVEDIEYLNYPDGYLVSSLEARKKVAGIIRKVKPNILVSCDPQNLFGSGGYLNHPDHRAAGQIVVDALFPAAGNPSFFPELLDEGLSPHSVNELWLSLNSTSTIELDVSDYWERRKLALLEHKSQIGDPQKFIGHLEERRKENDPKEGRYLERFKRVVFRK